MSYRQTEVTIEAGAARLEGTLTVPGRLRGLAVFAHGSGSSRHSPRNRLVAEALHARHIGTLLFDLLTPEEEREDATSANRRFDIDLLAARVTAAVDWVAQRVPSEGPGTGLYGASTGAAAALIAAARRPRLVHAVVSRGGRPDLAAHALEQVRAPTLLVVGGDDPIVLELNQDAAQRLCARCELRVVPGASHLFEEPGTLRSVARLTVDWFSRHLPPDRAATGTKREQGPSSSLHV